MKLYTYEFQATQRLGVEYGGRLVDLKAACADISPHESSAVQGDMLALLRLGEGGLAAVRRVLVQLAAMGRGAESEPWLHAFDRVALLAPVPRPGKILCSGINYASHLKENPGARLPREPFIFAKVPSAVVGPGAAIRCPPQTAQLDYEVELAVVIGRTMRHVSESDALSAIAGYTILHDVSARDVQFKDNQITLGKNFDTFCPMGPCLVTSDDIPNPDQLGLRAFVNGERLQDGSTRDWIFPLPKLLSFLSGVMTLEPGDVVSTGTPAGVGLFQRPPVFLKPGDVVRLEIDGIGALENPIIAA